MTSSQALQARIAAELSLARSLATERAREEYLEGPGRKRTLSAPGSMDARKARKIQSAYESRFRARHHERELEVRLVSAKAQVKVLKEKKRVLEDEKRVLTGSVCEMQNSELRKRNSALEMKLQAVLAENARLKSVEEQLFDSLEEGEPLTPYFDAWMNDPGEVEERLAVDAESGGMIPVKPVEFTPFATDVEMGGAVHILDSFLDDKGRMAVNYRPSEMPQMRIVRAALSA